MKKINITIILLLGLSLTLSGQENIFPTNGNVGIGTIIPASKLEVIGGSIIFRENLSSNTIKSTRVFGGAYSGNLMTSYLTSSSATNNQIVIGGGTLGGEAATLIDFNTNNTIGSNNVGVLRMRINSVGAVGIGANALDNVSLKVTRNLTNNANVYGILNDGQIQSDAISTARYFESRLSTVNNANLNEVVHYSTNQTSIGNSTSLTNHYGFTASSNLNFGTNVYGFYGNIPAGVGRWNLYMNSNANNYLGGSIGIGTTALAGYNIRVSKPMSGTTVGYGISINSTINSDITTAARYFESVANTQPNSIIPEITHYIAQQATFGEGSSISQQNGFYVPSSLTGATNNYAFRGNLTLAAGRWNLYMGGSANNFVAGTLGVGTTTLNGFNLRVAKAITGGAYAYGISSEGAIQNDVTTEARMIYTSPGIASGTTLSRLVHFHAIQGNALGTVTNQYGFYVHPTLIAGTNNYGFYGEIPAGIGRWNLYMAGSATNYLEGGLGIGTKTVPVDYKLAIAESVIADKVKVKKSTSGAWPDFVFAPTYNLPNLMEVETFVKQNKHLPEIPSAAEIEKDGQDLGEMNRLLLKKVEELTLYLIELKKENQQQNIEIEKLKKFKK